MRSIAPLAFLAASTGFSAVATAATPPGAINMVIAGAPDPANKVPAFNAVPGSQVANLSVAMPQALLTHGLVYIYWVSFQDFSFTGTCTMEYQLTQNVNGTKTVLDKHKILSFQCSPGLWGAGFGGAAVPNKPGLATLTGIVKFGSATQKLNTTVLLQ